MITLEDTVAINRTIAAAQRHLANTITPERVNQLSEAISRTQGILSRLYAASVLRGGVVVVFWSGLVVIREPGGRYLTMEIDEIDEWDVLYLGATVGLYPNGDIHVDTAPLDTVFPSWFPTPNGSESSAVVD